MAGDDEMLDSPDGFTDAERAQFNEMQASDGAPAPDAGADAPDSQAAPGGGAGDDAATAGAGGTAADTSVPGQGGAAKEGAAAAEPAATVEDDDEPADEAVLGADGKPVVGEDGQPKRRKARVSANKYNAEKARADKLDGELRTKNESLARYDERMRLLTEALTTPKADAKQENQEEQEPDPEADVFGWIKWSRAKTAKLEQAVSDMREGKQTEDGQRVVADAYISDATSFAQREPNFAPAYVHLQNSRVQELALYHFGVDLTAPPVIGSDGQPIPQLTQQQVARIKADFVAEERGIAENAIAQGRSPAAAIYQMARYRGYTPRQAAAAANGAANGANGHATNGANGAANGKAPVNGNGAAQNGKGPNVSEEIARIKAGTEAALSLSDGGASPANPMTPQKLADMPQDEFNAIMDRADPEEIRILFEGRA